MDNHYDNYIIYCSDPFQPPIKQWHLAAALARCSSSRKLVILFVVIAAAVIVLELRVIASVVRSFVLSKGFKPFM